MRHKRRLLITCGFGIRSISDIIFMRVCVWGGGWPARHGTSIRWARLLAWMFGHVHRAMCSDGCQFEVLEEHVCACIQDKTSGASMESVGAGGCRRCGGARRRVPGGRWGVGQLGMAHRSDGPASSLRMFGHVHRAMCGGGCQFEVLEEYVGARRGVGGTSESVGGRRRSLEDVGEGRHCWTSARV